MKRYVTGLIIGFDYSYNAAYAEDWANTQGSSKKTKADNLFSTFFRSTFKKFKPFRKLWKILEKSNSEEQLEHFVDRLPQLFQKKVEDNIIQVVNKAYYLEPCDSHGICTDIETASRTARYIFNTEASSCLKFPAIPSKEHKGKDKKLVEKCNTFAKNVTPSLCELLQEVVDEKLRYLKIEGADKLESSCKESLINVKTLGSLKSTGFWNHIYKEWPTVMAN